MAPNTHTHTHSEGQSNTIRNRCWSCLASHHIASLLFYYYYSDADVCHTLLDRLHSDVPDRHDVRITLIWIEYTICFFEFRHYYYYYVLLSEPVNPLCIFISVCSDGKWHEKFINIHCVGQDGRGSGVCIRVPDRAIYGIWRINLSNQPICSLCVMCIGTQPTGMTGGIWKEDAHRDIEIKNWVMNGGMYVTAHRQTYDMRRQNEVAVWRCDTFRWWFSFCSIRCNSQKRAKKE